MNVLKQFNDTDAYKAYAIRDSIWQKPIGGTHDPGRFRAQWKQEVGFCHGKLASIFECGSPLLPCTNSPLHAEILGKPHGSFARFI